VLKGGKNGKTVRYHEYDGFYKVDTTFSNVSSIVILYGTFSSELSFENFCSVHPHEYDGFYKGGDSQKFSKLLILEDM